MFNAVWIWLLPNLDTSWGGAQFVAAGDVSGHYVIITGSICTQCCISPDFSMQAFNHVVYRSSTAVRPDLLLGFHEHSTAMCFLVCLLVRFRFEMKGVQYRLIRLFLPNQKPLNNRHRHSSKDGFLSLAWRHNCRPCSIGFSISTTLHHPGPFSRRLECC